MGWVIIEARDHGQGWMRDLGVRPACACEGCGHVHDVMLVLRDPEGRERELGVECCPRRPSPGAIARALEVDRRALAAERTRSVGEHARVLVGLALRHAQYPGLEAPRDVLRAFLRALPLGAADGSRFSETSWARPAEPALVEDVVTRAHRILLRETKF